MKISTLSKVVGAGVLALTLVSLPVSAQTTNPDSTNTQTQGTDYAATEDRDFDWGWLGLIGLAGLAGLAGKKRQEPTRYREPDTAGTTGYRE